MAIAGFLGEVGSWTQVIVGVGLLIFIHEAGHFLVAKWAGVKVLAFSLGFGPEVWGFTRGDTRYRLALLPLGGYVKMSGENELPTGGYAPDDYPAKPVWVRSLIIVAGVAMNAVLGFALFAAALAVGLRMEPVAAGTVQPGKPAWAAGIRPGDRILRADGQRLIQFGDLIYATMEGRPLHLEVERDGRRFPVDVAPTTSEESRTPSIGISPDAGRILEVAPGSPAEKAGFRTGDTLMSFQGLPLRSASDLADDVLSAAMPSAGPMRIGVLRDGKPVEVEIAPVPPAEIPPGKARMMVGITPLRAAVTAIRPGGPAEAAGWMPGDRPVAVGSAPVHGAVSFARAVLRAGGPAGSVRVARKGGEIDMPLPASPGERLDLLRDLHFGEAESPTAVEVLPDGPPGPEGGTRASPAAEAGIPDGARITHVAGSPVTSFREITARIAAQKGAPLEIAWAVEGGAGRATLKAAEFPSYGLPPMETGGNEEVVRAGGPVELVSMAWSRCIVSTRQIVTTVTGIFRGSLDSSALGGPILIAQIAHRSTRSGTGQFLWLLGTLSINLMFLNVLPIPVLDGGQLALLALEAVLRRRPSESVVGIAQMAGLLLILSLVVLVSYNDIVRNLGP